MSLRDIMRYKVDLPLPHLDVSRSMRISFLHLSAVVMVAVCGMSSRYTSAADNDLPHITPLVPGIVVEPLPLRLPNINNLRFRPDGRLTAMGYNGKVYLLKDTNGDRLEDEADVFWDQPTIRVPVGMAWSEKGLYVSSQGKVSLLQDTDNDDRADKELVVSDGWPVTDVKSGGVDATSVTVDRQGNVYFALICASYSNPYRLQDGRSRYDKDGLRGTILRLPPDHARREVVCTGMRVPYALAFNRLGDLFVTDQEGATWLPGGNPLDELNHIVPGKHYGFPPRHDEYLPNVVDENPVVAFGPQHQSTCGLVFNEASPGQAAFGPAGWEGDALVAGLSRGRLWRVQLVKTAHGYVGRQTPIAISSMLMADVAISPSGDLYITCHSGPPDWGTGPQGEGRLFRLRFANRQSPQPVLAYSSGSMEVTVDFDRAIDPAVIDALRKQTIAYGAHVRAGDRLELLKPPYAAVEQQEKSYRGKLPIVTVQLADDGRSLKLKTAPHPVRGTYAIEIPGVRGAGESNAATTIELDYDLSGVRAEWIGQGSATPAWTGWLPHVDTEVAKSLCEQSHEHRALVSALNQPGALKLNCMIDLPQGRVKLRLLSSNPCQMRCADGAAAESKVEAGEHVIEIEIDSPAASQQLEVIADTSANQPTRLHLTYQRPNDKTERVVELARLSLPWTPPALPVATEEPAQRAVAVSGDPKRGEKIFFGQIAKCGDCHALHGRGAKLGPDLSEASQRSAASLLRDIREPSAAINPDYLSYSVLLTDGRSLSGTVRVVEHGSLAIADQLAKQTTVPIDTIEQVFPQATSMMPKGLTDALKESEVQDLLAYLLAPPTPQKPEPEFPRRSTAEIEAVMAALPAPPLETASKPIVITLVASKQDHGRGEHDYPAWQASWTKLLQAAKGVTVHAALDWPSPEQWRDSDVVVLYFWNHDWSAERLQQLDQYLARGGSAVVLHAGLISDSDPETLANRWGLAAQPKRTKYRHGPLELRFPEKGASDLIAGFSKLALVDETYWPMIGDRQKVNVLATAVEEGNEWPMVWTYQPGRGRVWASVIGHYGATLDDPLFRILVLRGIAWAADQPLHRLQGLATQ